MPTYDYVCDACGHAFDEFQSMTAEPLRRCPSCGKLKLRRLIGTGAGVLFKGSGFYETDYRSESYRKAADADKPKPASTEPTTKPDAAAAPKDAPAPLKPTTDSKAAGSKGRRSQKSKKSGD